MRTFARLFPLVAATVAGSTVVGCGSGVSSDGITTGPKPQISIALEPAAATVAAGGSVAFTVKVTGANGFAGPASISVSGVPGGVTATVSSAQLAGTVTTSSVTVAAAASVVPGVYQLTVSGSGSGVAGVAASFALTVSAPTGGFSLLANPSTVSLTQGSNTTATISLARTAGFAGGIGLSVSGMSSGLVATFNPSTATGNSAALSIAATSVAVTGTVTLTITASAAGLPSQTAAIQVTVTAASTSGNGDVTVDFTNCAAAAKPVWFARQDGTATWTQVTSTSDVYRFTISSAGGGYAYATTGDATHSAVTVSLLSRSELTAAPILICPQSTGNKTVTATIRAVGTSQTSYVSIGGSTVEASSEGPVSLTKVPNGTYDLIGWRWNSARGINTASDSRGVILRDVNAAAGESAGTLDFSAANVISPIAWGVSFNGAVAGDAFSGSMSYHTGASCVPAVLYTFSTTSPAVPALAYGIPPEAQRATDYHVLRVVATNGPTTRIAQQSFHSAGGVSSLRLRDPISAPQVSDLGAAGYRRLQVVGSTPSIYSSMVVFSYTDAVAARSATVQASVAALGGNAANIAFPDFSGVVGWNQLWMPATSSVNWTFGGTAATYTGLPCTEGATYYAAFYSESM